MMNVSRWSIRNPLPVVLFFILLTVIGALGFRFLKVMHLPDLDLPNLVVTIIYPGASPSALETEVVNKVESQLLSVSGLKHSYTSLVNGVATIVLEFSLEQDIQQALEDVRSVMSGLRPQLPADIREPIITRLDISSQTIMAYAVGSLQRSNIQLSELVEDVIRPRLALIPEVSRISVVGGVSREVQIKLDLLAMQALGISATEVSRQLSRVYSEQVAGQTLLASRQQQIRVVARVSSPAEIARLAIPLSDGRKIRLDEIAEIYEGTAERTSAAFLNGQEIIGFELSQSKGTDQIRFARKVHDELASIQRDYPDLQFSKTLDFVENAREEYHGSLRLLLEGALLTMIIVWVFLRDYRSTMIAALSLLLSIMPVFAGMYYLGFTINIVSLLAISLVIGVLVDDVIVEIENISRHMRMGKTPYQAAMEASSEIGLAVIATTFTIIAVFLPTVFMGGIGGLLFRQFGMTAVIAVSASLLVARMLTPVLAAYWLKPGQGTTQPASWLRYYMRLSRWCLENRGKTLLGALLFFVLSLLLITLLPVSFIPADNNTHTQVTLDIPAGTRLNDMVALVHKAEARLADINYIGQVYSTLGAGSAGADLLSQGNSHQAVLTIRLTERNQRPDKSAIQDTIVQRLADLPGVRVTVGLGASNDKYKVFLVSRDSQALRQASVGVEQGLRQIAGVTGVQAENSLQRPELAVEVDFQRAAELGVTAADIAQTLRIATTGDHEELLAKFNLPGRQIPIRVSFNDKVRTDLRALESLLIPGSRGAVRLAEVARLHLDSGPAMISRLDGLNSAGFTLSLGRLNLGEVQSKVYDLPGIRALPPSVAVRELGDAESSSELFGGFLLSMLIGALMIYLVLVLLFRNVLQPLTILVALPLATGGSFIAMLVTGHGFSLPTLIGFLTLMGIVTKNSILLVDYAMIAREQQGVSRTEAILDACHKRARPVIMTSLAMGFGMLPIALALGNADMTFRSPMAITIIGGLITSTLLSLLIVPAFFTCIDDLEKWLKRKIFPPAR